MLGQSPAQEVGLAGGGIGEAFTEFAAFADPADLDEQVAEGEHQIEPVRGEFSCRAGRRGRHRFGRTPARPRPSRRGVRPARGPGRSRLSTIRRRGRSSRDGLRPRPGSRRSRCRGGRVWRRRRGRWRRRRTSPRRGRTCLGPGRAGARRGWPRRGGRGRPGPGAASRSRSRYTPTSSSAVSTRAGPARGPGAATRRRPGCPRARSQRAARTCRSACPVRAGISGSRYFEAWSGSFSARANSTARRRTSELSGVSATTWRRTWRAAPAAAGVAARSARARA